MQMQIWEQSSKNFCTYKLEITWYVTSTAEINRLCIHISLRRLHGKIGVSTKI